MNKALSYAFRLLKYRMRSEFELRKRMKLKGFSDSQINQACNYLQEINLINDFDFAKAWVESRIKKPLGSRRLKRELQLKGVDKSIIRQVLEQSAKKTSEQELLGELAKRRWRKLSRLNPIKAKNRIYLFLLRRGFSAQDIRDVVSRL